MKYLCLDPSFTCCGWVLIEDRRILHSGTIQAPPKVGVENVRLERVLWELEEVINLHKPDMVLREEVVGSKSAKASRILNMLKGGIIGVCVGRRISYQSVAARRTKEFVAGKADASKEEMVNAVSQYFPEIMSIKPKYKQEAIADACALYITLRKEDWK